MVITAVSSFFNPYDVARLTGVQSRQSQPETSSTQNNAQQNAAQSPERVIQGEVISRQRIQNENTATTRDALAGRGYYREQADNGGGSAAQSAYGFNARQAVNTYIGNQAQGERIDRQSDSENNSLIDVYV